MQTEYLGEQDIDGADLDDPSARIVKLSASACKAIYALPDGIDPAALAEAANAQLPREGELADIVQVLVQSIAGAIYIECFNKRCPFNLEEQDKLQKILKSEMDGSLKNELLKISSASGEGNVETSIRVLECAMQYKNVAPTTLASILRDIARIDPGRAINEVTSRPWNPNLGPSTSRVFAEYVISNPERGSAEAVALGAIPAYQWAAAGIVQAIRGADPESAQKWREQITDTEAAEHADVLTYSLRTGP